MTDQSSRAATVQRLREYADIAEAGDKPHWAATMREAVALLSETATHTDHPARHWDRTCPACAGEKVRSADVVELVPDENGWVSFDCPNCGQHVATDPAAIGAVSAGVCRDDETERKNVSQSLRDLIHYGGNLDHQDRKNLLWKAIELIRNTSAVSATALTMPRNDEILLACGEMTAAELRTVKAALQWFINRHSSDRSGDLK